MNSTFDAVIVITVVCGLLMVVGGMVLLYKGTITLKDSNPDEAIRVEFKHMINVTTRYPALALFVIGLVFTVVALYFAQSEGLPPFTIDGTLQAEDPADATVIISFPVYNGTPDSNGTIKRTVHPVFDNITYEVSVPGYNSPIRGSMLIKDVRDGVLSMKDLKPSGQRQENKLKRDKIIAAPGLPAPDSEKKF